jgi:hypothetical protein
MTGYVYRGKRPDLGIDLETLNAAIVKARTETAAVPVLDVCGTNDGWLRHRFRHERPCAACRDAHGDPPPRQTRTRTSQGQFA